MLRSPRPIPRRFSRNVTPLTLSVVRRRYARPRPYAAERLQRFAQRLMQRVRERLSVDRRTVLSALAACAAVAVLVAVAIVFFSPLLTVHEVRVQRTDPRIDFEQVQNALAPVYGRPMFFLTDAEVSRLLRDAIPDLDSVDANKEYPRSLVLRLHYQPLIARLQVRDPDGVVINHLGSGAGLGDDYLTAEGLYVIYPSTAVASGTLLPALDVADWGVRPSPWTQLVPPESLATLHKAEAALASQFDLVATRRTIHVRAQEFHLSIGRISLWFDMRTPLSEQLQRLHIFVDAVGMEGVREYVDLRIKDKIVYR